MGFARKTKNNRTKLVKPHKAVHIFFSISRLKYNTLQFVFISITIHLEMHMTTQSYSSIPYRAWSIQIPYSHINPNEKNELRK